MSRLRATIRAPGLEFRLSRSRGPVGPEIDLLDLASCLEAAGHLRVRARVLLRGRREGDSLDLPLVPDPGAAGLPDRGELSVDLDLAHEDGIPVVDRLEIRVEPAAARLVLGDGEFGSALLDDLSATPFRTIRLETIDAERARLLVAGDSSDDPDVDLEIPRALTGLFADDGAATWRALLLALLALLDGGSIEIDAGVLGSLGVDLEGASGEVVDEAGAEGVLALPALGADLTLATGRYRLGTLDLPAVRGPVRIEAKLAPSMIPLGSRPGRVKGHLDCTAMTVTGTLGLLGGEARVDLEGRGRLQIVRTGDATSIRCSGVVLRAEGFRLGLEGEPGRDLRLDVATSPVSMTLGRQGAEFAIKAGRLTAPACALGDGRLRLDQAARFEQLRIAFRSPLQAGGLYASGAAAMDELEARGEFSADATEIEPIEIRGLRPSLSLAFERAGSAAQAAVTAGVILAGHTSLQGLFGLVGGEMELVLRAGDADEGVRLEGGEVEIHAPGLDAQASVETGPLQPERIEIRHGPSGLSIGMRLRRTMIGVREVSADVAGVEGAFRGEATGELSGVEIDIDRSGVRVASAGSGLMLRLHGEGVLRLGDTTVRLDRERATTIRLRGEVTREVDGRLTLRIDGGEVQARVGRSVIVREGRAREAGGADVIEVLAGSSPHE